MHIAENGEEDDEQFLVEVYLALFIDGVQIDGPIILNECLCVADGLYPIYLIESRVQILQYEKERKY